MGRLENGAVVVVDSGAGWRLSRVFRLISDRIRHEIRLLPNKHVRKQLSFLMRKPCAAAGTDVLRALALRLDGGRGETEPAIRQRQILGRNRNVSTG